MENLRQRFLISFRFFLWIINIFGVGGEKRVINIQNYNNSVSVTLYFTVFQQIIFLAKIGMI